MRTSEFFVTSAPVACGGVWLVNALIKLGFKGTSLFYKTDNWVEARPGYWQVGSRAKAHMESHLPALLEQEEFIFRKDLEFFWEHRISYPANPHCPVIVVVRDPRDAIFSLHRRWKKNGWIEMEFDEYLTRPSEWPDHFPSMFFMNPVKTYLFYHLIWLKSAQFRPVHFVKFEDLKESPLSALKGILEFLGAKDIGPDRIEAAIESSSLERHRALQQTKGITEGEIKGALHKGEVFEWKTTYKQEWLVPFESDEVQSVLALLGYSVNNSALTQRLRKLVNGRAAGFADITFSSIVNMLGAESVPRLAKYTRNYTAEGAEVRLVANRWASLWANGDDTHIVEMQSFLFQLMRLLLTPYERSHSIRMTKEAFANWNADAYMEKLSRYSQLNALEN